MGGFFSLLWMPQKVYIPENIEQDEPICYEVQEIGKPKCMFTKTPYKYGLLVGINYITNETEEDDLQGCVNDMDNLSTYLQEHCHFNKEQLSLLKNKEASRENIIKELNYMVFHSHKFPNSELWFSYSGHGSTEFSFFEKDNQSEVICPSDYITAGMISDVWLQDNFIRKLHKDTKLFVLMDCCHSGSNMNLPYELVQGREEKREYNYNENLCTIVKMSGCRDDQTSADYYDNQEREYQGALTNEFLKLNAQSSMATNIQIMERNLINRQFTQRPVLAFSNVTCSEMTLV